MAYCQTCDRGFVDGNTLRKHIRFSSKHPEKAYCEQCNCWFEDDQDLDSHFFESDYHCKCFRCNHNFCDGVAQQQHFRDSSLHTNNYCEYCDRYYEDSIELTEHYNNNPKHPKQTDIRPERRTYRCPRCTTIFSSPSDLLQHQGSGHQICQFCLRQFNISAFEAHLIVKEHYCRACNIKYGTKHEFEEHRKTSPKHFWCNACSSEYQTAENLKKHCIDSSDHYYCIECDLPLVTKAIIADHFDKSSNHYYCRKCDRNFVNSVDLIQHLDLATDLFGELVHQYCKLCSAEFGSIEALQIHKQVSAAHHWCTVCGCEFASSDFLQDHLKAAPKEHYFCIFCSQAFNSAEHYELHAQEFHVWCSVDGECFASQETFLAHVRAQENTHFYCDECDDSFPSADLLELHNWRRHKSHPPCQHGHVVVEGTQSAPMAKHPKNIEQHCLTCKQKFPTKKEMLRHCENGGCYILPSQLYALIRKKDPVGHFTTPQSFKCPRPVCGAFFEKITALLEHLEGCECGDWVKRVDLDGLDFLRWAVFSDFADSVSIYKNF